MSRGWVSILLANLIVLIGSTLFVCTRASRAYAITNPISSSVSASFTIAATTGNVTVNGDAFPSALMTLLVDGTVAGTTVADSTGAFSKTLSAISGGNHTIGAYATDKNGKNSATVSISVTITNGSTVTLSGFLFPPTFAFSSQLASGSSGTYAYLRPRQAVATGYAKPNTTLTFWIDGVAQLSSIPVAADGSWSGDVNSGIMHLGNHTIAVLMQTSGGTTSDLSDSAPFVVQLSPDIAIDDKVNIGDFSVLMYNWTKGPNRAADVNDDSATDLIDLSVMLYYWTG